VRHDPREADVSVNVDPRTPLHEFATLLIATGVAAALLMALAFVLVDLALALVPPETEARLFRDLAAAPREALDPDDARQRRAAALLEALAEDAGAGPYDFRLGLLDAERPNAVALPGGTILVSPALVDGAASENELAFVLAHELGHYANRDHLRALGRGFALGLLASAVGFGVGTDWPAMVGTLTRLGFAREQERAADAFALAQVQARYGHVAGAADFFARLEGPDGGWLATHPGSEDRIAALRALARERGWPINGATRPLPPR
jgi:Zn-dependent protease with chaperone function